MTVNTSVPRTLDQWLKQLERVRLPVTTQSRDLVLHTVLDSRRSLRDIAERLQDCPAAALAVMREANRSIGSLGEPAATLETALNRIGLKNTEELLRRLPVLEESAIPQPLRQLQLISQHAGPWLAEQVAAALVVDRQRGQQTRFQPLLPTPRQDDPALLDLLRWLQRRHAESIDLEMLAARLHCSTRTLLRRFKAATGLTPNDYLQRLRIVAAQSALLQPQQSLEQIALSVGYQDRATFSRLFKQLCGETPGAYRRRVLAP